MTSEGGRGTLTIHDVKEADQGAYTCEAMNARGMVFGIPDGVLELIPQRGMVHRAGGHQARGESRACPPGTGCSPLPCRPPGPCPDGHFYLEHSASCLPCFCFGVTNVCQSSRRFRDQIQLRFDQPNDFKGALVGERRAPGSRRLRGQTIGNAAYALGRWSQSGEAHRAAEEMPGPVGKAFQGKKKLF